MPLVDIHGGARVEIPDLAEVEAIVGAAVGPDSRRDWWAEAQSAATARDLEHYRAVKPLRRDASLTTPAGTRLTVTDSIMAESGQVWLVRLLSAQLAAAGTMQAFITSDTDTRTTAAVQRRLIANGASNQYQVFTFNTGACILQPDEGLFLSASQNIVAYFVAGWQAPAEMVGKLA